MFLFLVLKEESCFETDKAIMVSRNGVVTISVCQIGLCLTFEATIRSNTIAEYRSQDRPAGDTFMPTIHAQK